MSDFEIPYAGAAQFFRFAREREKIRNKRHLELAPPWTKDWVLQQYRFCNVFREDDKVTIWFRENIRDLVRKDPVKSLMACVAFRWFNTQDAGEVLAPIIIGQGWATKRAKHALRRAKLDGAKLFTGAYMLKSPAGVDKITGLCDCINEVWKAAQKYRSLGLGQVPISLQRFHKELMSFPFLGRFMSYEVVTDLRHTCVLDKATDIDSWASAGPGAARGLGWLLYDDPTMFNYVSKSQEGRMLGYMRSLLALSRNPNNWDQRAWEMREVEHVLCEYDKWRRGHAGQKLKRKFIC